MHYFRVEITGKDVSAIIDGTQKILEFVTVRVVLADTHDNAISAALKEVLDLCGDVKLIANASTGLPSLVIYEIEELIGGESNGHNSTGLIFYDP